jgi:hypothetical protein
VSAPMDDAKRLLAAANKAGITGKCSGCGERTWIPIGYVVGLLLDGAPKAENLHRTLGVACGKCGLIRLHSAQILDQYMDPRDR